MGLCASFSDVVTAAPLYENWTRRAEGCPNIFSPVLCRDFDFILESERAARFEEDRVLARPRSAVIIDACTVAALIRETEALPSSRFMELRFERITISGTLHLSEIDPRARLSFVDVNFVPKPSKNDPDAGPGVESRGQSTSLPASAKESAPSIEGGWNIAAPEPPECLRSEPLEPAFAGASVVIERSGFRDRVRFEGALFEGSVIVSGSAFDSNFDIVESDVGGDLVLESSAFASDLELGRDTILRGQIVVDGVRVGGDMDINGIEVIDTYLPPQEDETFTTAPDPQEVETPTAVSDASSALDMTPACVCAHRDGSFNVDKSRLDVEPPSGEEVAQACERLPNLPRCPRSNGFNPVLIEISRTDVAGSFSFSDLALGSRGAGFRPFKSTDLRFGTQQKYKTCSLSVIPGFSFIPGAVIPGAPPPPKCESSLSRLKSANILLEDVSVAGTALLRSNQGNTLNLYQSSIERMSSEGNEFHSLVIARNEFGAFSSVKDTFYRELWVVRNNVTGSLALDSAALSGDLQQKEPLSVSVTHNLVGRDLEFTPSGVTDGTIEKVDLSTNRVGGELAISLPVGPVSAPTATDQAGQQQLAWSGQVPLKGVEVDGTLAIRFAKPDARSGRMIQDSGTLAEAGVLCGARDDALALVHLDLANTTAKNLLWAVPLETPEDSAAHCVSWEGVGLRYDNWEAGPGWGDLDHEDGSVPLPQLLDLWRALYVRAGPDARAGGPPPDPLHHMADYLAKIGQQKASRQIRADAKRAGFPLPGGDNWTTVGNAIAWIIFLPTDFGTKPEWAFLALAGFMLLAWVTYTLCCRYYRTRWPDLRENRDIVVARDEMREAMGQHLAGRALDSGGDDLHVTEERLEELLDRYVPIAVPPRGEEVEIRHISAVPGFMQYDRNRQPQDFMIWRYALDTMIPVIDLHAYNQYYPKPKWLRTFAMFQHLVGWWVLTSFVASLAVL